MNQEIKYTNITFIHIELFHLIIYIVIFDWFECLLNQYCYSPKRLKYNFFIKFMIFEPSFFFNSAIAIAIAGIILLFNGLIVLSIIFFLIAILSLSIWFFSGLFEKFEPAPSETNKDQDDDDSDGRGVLKPF